MTEPYKKKLIEVAIPLEAINAASAREKSIRHGHPSTLHLWWARRPLAACRAVLFAQLVDDPSSHPDKFSSDEEIDTERKRLFKIIEDLVVWENSTNEEVLEQARAEIRKSCGELPPVYDPFSGGGAIPLEAQRLGLASFGSDLNPVAVMIGKAMIEIPSQFKNSEPVHPGSKERNHYRYAEGLAEDIKYYGDWIRKKAWQRIGSHYPDIDLPPEYGGGKASVICWIWSRTVPSPDPAFSHIPVPLVRSFQLSTKRGKRAWIEPIIDGDSYRFEVKSEAVGDKGTAIDGTVNRQGGKCLISNAAIPFKYIREKAKSGEMGQRLMAIVAKGPNGRVFLSPQNIHSEIALSSNPIHRPGIPICHWPGRTNVVEYGMETFGDLYTDRQAVALSTFCDLVLEVRKRIQENAVDSGFSEGETSLNEGGMTAKSYSEAISVYLALAVCRTANTLCTIARWTADRQQTVTAFARQAIPMTWDFPEVNPFGGAAGDFEVSVGGVIKGLFGLARGETGVLLQADAQTVQFPPNAVISTDPPYYDNISYADLSDFFFSWLRPTLRPVYPELFGLLATPKTEELIANPHRHGGKETAEAFFLEGMSKAISNMAQNSSESFPATIYYAFKQSEINDEGISSTGWATFLQAVIDAGYSIVGTWPMRTEMANRMIATGTNALANSVVLVCRKRENTADTINRAEFLRTLKRELPSAISDLQAANIAPADMPQSAIGPGMGVFSRYTAILESDDSLMSVKSALQLINRELDEFLNDVQGEFDADTRFAITWFEQNGTNAGEYGTANNIATARGISVDSVKHAGIVESLAGKVRILKRDELLEDWDPLTDSHLTIWECLQYLVQEHEVNGISHDAAVLLKKMDDKAEAIKDLAYCLYDICANKRQDAKEATAYNALIADWTELTRQAAAISDVSGERQSALDL
jgi:putative DNA methylase